MSRCRLKSRPSYRSVSRCPSRRSVAPDTNLYRVVTCIVSNGQAVDTVTTPLGHPLHRLVDHQGLPTQRQDDQILRRLHITTTASLARRPRTGPKSAAWNCSAHRLQCGGTSHNPPSPAFLDACDRLGLLVIDEAFDCWNHGKNDHDYHEAFHDWWQRNLDALVLRDMNHPAVMMWSIGNELPEQSSEEGAETAKMLAEGLRT